MRNLLIAISVATCMIHGAYAQQGVQFSQYVFDGLTLNPAYAGYKGSPYLNTTFRDQWTGFTGAPKTAMVSFDGLTNVSDDKMGLGVQLLYDELGPQQNYSLTGSYSYRIPLNGDQPDDPHRLCLGIGGMLSQYSLNGSSFQYEDPGDPMISDVTVRTKFVPDANFGVYYYTKRFYAGGSLMNLFSINGGRRIYYANGSTYSSLLQGTTMYLTAGGMLDVSDEVKFKPSVMVKEDFKGPTNTDFNAFFLFDEILWVGGSYRTSVKLWDKSNLQQNLQASDAASVMAEFYVTPDLRVGYSYDFTTSGLSNYQSGSHEISVGLTFKTKRSGQYMATPRYF
jgi:type IX secretion system PorP/SprF family membrane protein